MALPSRVNNWRKAKSEKVMRQTNTGLQGEPNHRERLCFTESHSVDRLFIKEFTESTTRKCTGRLASCPGFGLDMAVPASAVFRGHFMPDVRFSLSGTLSQTPITGLGTGM